MAVRATAERPSGTEPVFGASASKQCSVCFVPIDDAKHGHRCQSELAGGSNNRRLWVGGRLAPLIRLAVMPTKARSEGPHIHINRRAKEPSFDQLFLHFILWSHFPPPSTVTVGKNKNSPSLPRHFKLFLPRIHLSLLFSKALNRFFLDSRVKASYKLIKKSS